MSHQGGDPSFYRVCLPAAAALQGALAYLSALALRMPHAQRILFGQASRTYKVFENFPLHRGAVPAAPLLCKPPLKLNFAGMAPPATLTTRSCEGIIDLLIQQTAIAMAWVSIISANRSQYPVSPSRQRNFAPLCAQTDICKYLKCPFCTEHLTGMPGTRYSVFVPSSICPA